DALSVPGDRIEGGNREHARAEIVDKARIFTLDMRVGIDVDEAGIPVHDDARIVPQIGGEAGDAHETGYAQGPGQNRRVGGYAARLAQDSHDLAGGQVNEVGGEQFHRRDYAAVLGIVVRILALLDIAERVQDAEAHVA